MKAVAHGRCRRMKANGESLRGAPGSSGSRTTCDHALHILNAKPVFPVNRWFDKTFATAIGSQAAGRTGERKGVMSNSKGADISHRRRAMRNLTALVTAALATLAMTATARPQSSPQPSTQASPQAAGDAARAEADQHARPAKNEEKRRVISITLGKGETYTISGLKKGAAIASKTVANPNALSIQPQPSGDIVLLGTEGGRSKIDATLASGEQVTYDVTVKAGAPAINSLAPGSAPTAISP